MSHRPTNVAAAVLTLALAACTASSPTSSAPSATGNATVEIANFAFGPAVTIKAGQSVVFTNKDGATHTVTEGTAGLAASNACVNAHLGRGGSVTVTFNQPGDYQITCTIQAMQTVVHVQ
jgi:plastocyanin